MSGCQKFANKFHNVNGSVFTEHGFVFLFFFTPASALGFSPFLLREGCCVHSLPSGGQGNRRALLAPQAHGGTNAVIGT